MESAILGTSVHSYAEKSVPLLLLDLGRTLLYVIVAAALCLKLYLTWIKDVYKGTCRMDGKTVIVTGSNSGLDALARKQPKSLRAEEPE